MARELTPLYRRLRVLARRLLQGGLFLSSLFSLSRLLFSLSGSWMTNHSKSNLLPKTRSLPSEEEIEQNAHLLFQQIEGQLTLCDIKAYLTITLDAALVILLIFAEGQNLHKVFQPVTPQLERIADLGLFLTLFLFLCSCFSAVQATFPTVQDRDRISLLYPGHIAVLKHDKFVMNFQEQPLRELKESLLSEVYTKAKIARRKLSLVTWSLSFFFASLLLWVIAQLFLLVPA